MVAEIGAILLLSVCGVCDIRKKRIPVWTLIGGSIWALICVLLRCFSVNAGGAESGGLRTIGGILVAVLPGVFFLLLSFLTEKKVGYGDGILLMILGFMEGLSAVVFTCCMALFFQSLVAVVLVVAKKADKQTEIPFVPFMFLARILYVFR